MYFENYFNDFAMYLVFTWKKILPPGKSLEFFMKYYLEPVLVTYL